MIMKILRIGLACFFCFASGLKTQVSRSVGSSPNLARNKGYETLTEEDEEQEVRNSCEYQAGILMDPVFFNADGTKEKSTGKIKVGMLYQNIIQFTPHIFIIYYLNIKVSYTYLIL